MPKPKNSSEVTLDSTNLRKNFVWNLIGSTAASFLSLFLMMIVTRLNGIDDAGIFAFAFSTASLFTVIGTYSGRTFQVTDKNRKTTDSDYFYLKIVTSITMLIIGLIFCFIRGYSGDKILVIMSLVGYRVFEVLSEWGYAVIQKKDRLYQVGRSMVIKTLLSLAGFFIVDHLTHNIALSCAMVIFGHLMPMIFYDLPNLMRTQFKFGEFNPKKVQYLFKIGFFTFGFTFLNLYVVGAAKYALDSAGDNSAQTIYGIIAMPATVLSLVGQYLIQPFLTNFKKFFASDANKFQALVAKLCLAIAVIGTVCVLAAWLMGLPVLELLYAIELDGNTWNLVMIIMGGVFGALVLVISTVLVTMRHTSDQFWIFCVVSLMTLGISHILVSWGGIMGACLSYLTSMILLFGMYLVVFLYRMRELRQDPDREVRRAATE